MIILDGKIAHQYQSQVLELDDCFSIMNQIYDKDTLLPRRFSFFNTPTTTPSGEALWYKTAYVRATPCASNATLPTQAWAGTTQKNPMAQRTFLIDNKNPNIIYVFRNSVYDESVNGNTIHTTFAAAQLVKLVKEKRNIYQERVNVLAPDVSGTTTNIFARDGKYLYDFLAQTDDYIWVKCAFTYYKFSANNAANSTIYDSQSYSRIKCFSKNDLSLKYNINLGYVNTELITVKGNHLYLSCSGNANIYSVVSINMSDGAKVTLSVADELGINFYCTPSTIDSNGCFYISRDKINGSLHTISIQKYKIDFSISDTVTKYDVTLQNFYPEDFPLTVGQDYITTLTTHTDSDGQRYINLIIHGYGDNLGQSGLHRIVIFKYRDENTFEYYDTIKFDAQSQIRSLFSLMDDKLIVFAGQGYVYFLRWNEAGKTFTCSDKYVIPVKNVGVDTNNNVWVQRTDNIVEMLAASRPTEFTVIFEKEKYEYQNKPIESFINVICKNHLGDFVYTSVKIMLTGNLYFKENGKQVIEKSTNVAGPLNIPIVINGSGMFYADIDLI